LGAHAGCSLAGLDSLSIEATLNLAERARKLERVTDEEFDVILK